MSMGENWNMEVPSDSLLMGPLNEPYRQARTRLDLEQVLAWKCLVHSITPLLYDGMLGS